MENSLKSVLNTVKNENILVYKEDIILEISILYIPGKYIEELKAKKKENVSKEQKKKLEQRKNIIRTASKIKKKQKRVRHKKYEQFIPNRSTYKEKSTINIKHSHLFVIHENCCVFSAAKKK